MLKLGAARKDAGRAWGLVDIRVPTTEEELSAHGCARSGGARAATCCDPAWWPRTRPSSGACTRGSSK